MPRKILKRNVASAIFAWTFLFVPFAHAATLSLSPAEVQVSAGNTIDVKVLVSTDGAAINTVAATMQFPADLLQVVSINQNASIFSLWAQNPVFSNLAGDVTFTGGLPSPGFTGQNGDVLSVLFRAKKQGTASIDFSNSSVLQNDGLGTDILTGTQPASIAIGPAVPAPAPTPVVSQQLPTAVPVSTSSVNTPASGTIPQTSASGMSPYLPYILILLLLSALLLLTAIFLLGFRHGMKAPEMAGGAHQKLMTLKAELNSRLHELEKVKEDRELNQKEEEIFGKLQETVDKIDASIADDIRKIT